MSFDVVLFILLIGSLQVKDLEVELDTNKQKNKENMQQAILIERERLTQMQWDMEELRRKSLEMELKLKSKEVTY
jgi:biopolymer transport protein ExbD